MLEVKILPHHYRMMMERGICASEFTENVGKLYFVEPKKQGRFRVYAPEIKGAFIIRPDGNGNSYKTVDCFFEFPYSPRESAKEMKINWDF